MRDDKYVEFKGVPRVIFYTKNPSALLLAESANADEKDKFTDVSPTELVKNTSENVLEKIAELLGTIFIQEAEAGDEIEIPNMVLTSRGFYEEVSDLNGHAIPSIYYDHLFRLYAADGKSPPNVGANILKHLINDCLCGTKDHEHLTLKRLVDQIPDVCDTASDYLRLSNLYVAAKEGLLYKWYQIEPQDYGWITNNLEEQCLNRLDDIIGLECEEEPPLIEKTIIDREMSAENANIHTYLLPHFPNNEKKFRFSARVDLLTKNTIFELKCTSSITFEHRLQVVLYRWLWDAVHTPDLNKRRNPECSDPREVRIVNIKTGEILKLNATFEDLTTIVVELLKGKYEPICPKTDEEFVLECERVILGCARQLNQDDEDEKDPR